MQQPARFTPDQIQEMQNPYGANRQNWELSATYSAMLIMENDGDVCEYIDKARRVDGTATTHSIMAAFKKFDIKIDEWAIGECNFEVMTKLFNEERQVEIPDTIRLALRTAKLEKDRIQLTMQLDRADYDKVNKIIEALGGKWNRTKKAHVFTDQDPEDQIANYLETGKLDRPEDFGFFPTPAATGRVLINEAGLTPDSVVLEPQGGTGGLADLIAEIVPKANIQCYEIQPVHCETLRKKGYAVQNTDFLSVEPRPLFTHVICNPPFKNQQDIDHVIHALKFLKPGGKLSAIMSGSITFRSNRKTQEFLQLIEQLGGTISENEAGAFKESGTMVRTVRVNMTVPVAELPEEYTEPDCPPISMQTKGLQIHSASLVTAKAGAGYVQSAFTF